MTTSRDTDAQAVAVRTATLIADRDLAARGAGIRVIDVGPGRARASLTVEEWHLNGHGVVHGGYLFLLADAAFAYACNSRGVATVAAGGDISFLRPALLGEELIADATERALVNRSGLYDVTVRTAAGQVVAEFRGRSRAVTHPMASTDQI